MPADRDPLDDQDAGMRLYLLLALFDSRGDHPLDDMVRSAREGFERCSTEDDAWAEFDRLWGSFTSDERLRLAATRRPAWAGGEHG
jgi:hypothetical protein